MIIRMVISGIAAILCGVTAILWAKKLLSNRRKDYPLSARAEKILCAVMILPGVVIGYYVEEAALLVIALLILILCATVSVTDWYYRLIPNPIVLGIFALKLLMGIGSLLGVPGLPEFKIVSSLVGCVGCFLIFMAPGLFGKNVGAGDVKLAAAMGFLLGIYGALLGIVIMGLLVIGYSIVQRKMPLMQFVQSMIPMGPFIAAGMMVSQIASPILL